MKTMKKYVRILLVAMMSLMVLILAGCGDKADINTYNQAKNEVTEMAKAASMINDSAKSPFFSIDSWTNDNMHREHQKERLQVLEGELKKHQELDEKIDKKLVEMEKAIKGNKMLENEFKTFKGKILEERKQWITDKNKFINGEKTL